MLAFVPPSQVAIFNSYVILPEGTNVAQLCYHRLQNLEDAVRL